MKKTVFGLFCFIIVFVLGCAARFSIEETKVEPSQVAPGEDAKIFVVFKGPKDKVANVTATVREYPEMVIPLNDKGENGDIKAGDNIWTFKMTIPWEAPADIYHLDISVYDQSGNEIITKGFEQQSTGRSGTIELTIK